MSENPQQETPEMLLLRMRERLELHPNEPLLAGAVFDQYVAEAVQLGPRYEEALRIQFNRQFVQACKLAYFNFD